MFPGNKNHLRTNRNSPSEGSSSQRSRRYKRLQGREGSRNPDPCKGLLVTVPRARAAVCPKVKPAAGGLAHLDLYSLELRMSGKLIQPLGLWFQAVGIMVTTEDVLNEYQLQIGRASCRERVSSPV